MTLLPRCQNSPKITSTKWNVFRLHRNLKGPQIHEVRGREPHSLNSVRLRRLPVLICRTSKSPNPDMLPLWGGRPWMIRMSRKHCCRANRGQLCPIWTGIIYQEWRRMLTLLRREEILLEKTLRLPHLLLRSPKRRMTQMLRVCSRRPSRASEAHAAKL